MDKKKKREMRICFSRIGWFYLIFSVVANLSPMLLSKILLDTGIGWKIEIKLYSMIMMLSMYPVSVPLLWLLMKKVPAKGGPGRERWGIGKLAGFFVFERGIMYAGSLIGIAVAAFLSSIKGVPAENHSQDVIFSMDLWMILVETVMITPIIEELVYRKLLLDRIAGYGCLTAMTVSALLFGLAHGNFYQFFYAFGIGMVYSYIYLHTGKITYTIGFHMICNFMGTMVNQWTDMSDRIPGAIGEMMSAGIVMTLLGFIICAAVLLVVCRKDLYFYPAIDKLSRGKTFCAVWLNSGMFLLLLYSAVFFMGSL